MKRESFLPVLFLAFGIPFVGLSQSNGSDYTVPTVDQLVRIPPSPEASAFTKYGNTEVSLYTGTPEINIPLATITGREIKLPINLSYDATGIKVSQIATWVGLGWNLDVGGVITRQVNGLPDDYLEQPAAFPAYIPFYYNDHQSDTPPLNVSDFDLFSTYNLFPNSAFPAGVPYRYGKLIQDLQLRKKDLQPDFYSFNITGVLAGKVFLDYHSFSGGKISGVCMEHPDIKVTAQVHSNGVTLVIDSWNILDKNGNSYTFNQAEVTKVFDGEADGIRAYNSSWFLTTVQAANNRDLIAFNYSTPTAWQQPQLACRTETRKDLPGGSSTCQPSVIFSAPPTYLIYQFELLSITVNGIDQFQFVPSANSRCDLIGKKALVQLNLLSTPVKHFNFVQSYFSTDGSQPSQPDIGQEVNFRLRLDKLSVSGDDPGLQPMVYSFNYYGSTLPSRVSYAQDYWGYYNGHTENTTLVPTWTDGTTTLAGANRTPNLSAAKRGALTYINYPTGGATAFQYTFHNQPSTSTQTINPLIGSAAAVGYNAHTDYYQILKPASYTRDYLVDEEITVAPSYMWKQFNIIQGGSYQFRISTMGSPSGGSIGHEWDVLVFADTGAEQNDTNFRSIVGTAWGNVTSTSMSFLLNMQGGAFSMNSTVNKTLNLSPGLYNLIVISSDIAINVDVVAPPTTIQVPSVNYVSGLRLLSKTDLPNDEGASISKYYYYDDYSLTKGTNVDFTDENTAFSGIVQVTPNFITTSNSGSIDLNSNYIPCSFLVRSSTNAVSAPNSVTYTTVSEIEFSNGKFNGFTVYQFSNASDNAINNLPYVPTKPKNGKLLSMSVYDSNYNLLHNESYTYEFQTTSTQLPAEMGILFSPTFNSQAYPDMYIWHDNVSGTDYYTMEPLEIVFLPATDPFDAEAGKFTVEVVSCTKQAPSSSITKVTCFPLQGLQVKGSYGLAAYWLELTRKVVSEYSQSIDGTWSSFDVVNVYNYANPNHFQMTSSSVYNGADYHLNKYYYPQDISSPDAGITALINSHQWGLPVRMEAYKNNALQEAENTVFYSTGLPQKKQYSTSNQSLEDRFSYDLYDTRGNILQLSKTNDLKTSCIWSYNQTYLIAKVANALSNQIFHTSFEETGDGDSAIGDAKTGQKSKTGSYTKQLSNLSSGNYILSYWSKQNGNWIMTVQPVTVTGNTYTISLTGQIDEVRFYPVGAQMTTFTYCPLVGVTSMMDSNNQLTTYEYDALGRVASVRDNNGKLLKTYTYHYRTN
jgi:YD repeat-containing protein